MTEPEQPDLREPDLREPDLRETDLRETDLAETDLAGTFRQFARPATLAVLVLTAAVALVWRFVISTPLWLDEALSVNIASLGPSDIFAALKRDGHPPLYYLLLHLWMNVFGTGDTAVRAMSGAITLATIPLAYLTGARLASRRLGLTVAMLFVFSPYVLRYGSETRMYALVMAEVFVGYLALHAAWRKPTPLSLALVAAATSALLWTHYWAMWLIAAVGLMLVVAWVRDRRRDRLAPVAAMVVGGLSFLPWLPTLLYQNEHTGTPWAPSFRATTLVVTSLTEFAGGPYSEAQIGMLVSVVLVAIGVFGTGIDDHRIQLDFHAHRLSRIPLIAFGGTIAIASAVGLINGMAFAPRYAAVYFPLFIVLVALGVDQFRGGLAREVLLIGLAALSLAGMFLMTRQERSQALVATDLLQETSKSAVVVACPDQLGPSVARLLPRDDYEVFTYPRFGAPELVDWVDYAERNARNDPVAFGNELVARAAGRPIFIVLGDKFLTLEKQCPKLIETIAALRPGNSIMEPVGEDFYEPIALFYFPPV